MLYEVITPQASRLLGCVLADGRDLAAVVPDLAARLAAAADGEALERLTARLLALSGFDVPAATSGDGS